MLIVALHTAPPVTQAAPAHVIILNSVCALLITLTEQISNNSKLWELPDLPESSPDAKQQTLLSVD